MKARYISMAWTPPLIRQTVRISRHSRYWFRKTTRHTQAQMLGRWAELDRGSRRLPERMQLSCGDQAAGAWWCPGPAEASWRENKTPHIDRPSYLGQNGSGKSEVESGRACRGQGSREQQTEAVWGLRATAGVVGEMVQGQVTLLDWIGLDWACTASGSLQLLDFSPAKQRADR